ncbi:unnamed protein product [Ambrosiozyma monospora]|uniref:Unnamed protein product n=1 Tax=Ambrosiozyma monospora TaxID=43982 RepID=A0ACB5TAZ5_AMBMO|nr:unnamed protein product [Ambrosiozyma monospora]
MVEVHIATYSKVDVYESTINNIPLMRRCSDNWVNATQVLKVAGFGKAQRTRLLEREVHQLQHEKIQGGYGRFQGTWVPLETARDLAIKHKIPEDHTSVLYYDPDRDGPLQKLVSASQSQPRKRKPKGEGNGNRPSKKQSPMGKKTMDLPMQLTGLPPTFGGMPPAGSRSTTKIFFP